MNNDLRFINKYCRTNKKDNVPVKINCIYEPDGWKLYSEFVTTEVNPQDYFTLKIYSTIYTETSISD